MSTHPPGSFAFESPAAAVESLLARVRPVQTERLALSRAAGRILAEPIHSDRPSPPADVSAMDGFALRAADGRLPAIPIEGEVRIGLAPPPLSPGTCLRIVTGGGLPPGADTIVKREDVVESAESITLTDAAACVPGRHIRRAGENAPAGAVVAEPGSLITPAVLAALAAVGAEEIRVFRGIAVAVFSTGDELAAMGTQPTPFQLRDSNGPALRSLLTDWSWITELRPEHIPDEPDRVARAIGAALSWADAILLTGGVSAGHRDFVPAALEAHGIRPFFHRLPQRPGMPILAAVTSDGRPVLGLPGNPVSVMVTARRIAWPALTRRAGQARSTPPPVVSLVNPDETAISLWWHRPVHLAGPGEAALIDTRGSGDLIAAARADGFVELPPGARGPGPWPYFAWRP